MSFQSAMFRYTTTHSLLSSIDSPSTDDFPTASSASNVGRQCTDIDNCRTIEGIVYSCFSVMFACTWVAVHPNIPRNFDKAQERNNSFEIHSAIVTLRNVLFMVMALFSPELIVLWAVRQWFAVRITSEKYKKYGWTKAHGFFLIMGGFALFEDGKYLGTLEDSNDWTVDEKDIARRILENYTNSSSVTNSVSQSEGDQPTEVITTVSLEGTRNHPEVQETQNLNVVSDIDSSKCLTEFLVANGLISITEDEIMEKSTGDALSKIVVVGQTLWFIVQCVARGIEGLVVTKLEISTLAFATLSFATYYFWWNKPQRVRFPVKIEIYPKKLDTTPKSTGNESFWKGIQSAWEAIRELTLFKYEEVDKIWDESPPTPIRIIIFPIVSLLQQCGDMVAGLTHFETGLEEVETPIWIYAPVISFAVVFGAIHSIAWSSESPSFRETAYWREGALLVTCLPILAMVLIKIEEILQRLPDSWGAILKTVLFMLLPWVYMLARTILVILALIELRALPFDAYRTVQWTNLIPHI